ncbi:MAG: hypothetical protein ACREFJ_04960, partial [Acetobacteraceae bacterium]
MGGSTISVDGIDPNFLRQAHNFTGKAIILRAGMGPGLPLANPKQAGMIVQGKVYQAFGNWQGTQITGNFVVTGGEYSFAKPGNLVLNWKAGTPLSTAITNTLQTAYPGVSIHTQIHDVKLSHDEVGAYSTVQGLATMLAGIT